MTEPTVWILTEKDTGNLAMLQGAPQEEKGRVFGPFIFTQEEVAKKAADNYEFRFSDGHLTETEAQEIPVQRLWQGIISGFGDVEMDCFIFDEGLFPMSEEGAKWLDLQNKNEHWAPLFKENGPAWIQEVMNQIGAKLGVETPEFQIAPPQAVMAAVAARSVDVMVVPEDGGHKHTHKDGTLCPDTEFWAYSTGMERFDLPNIEMRFVDAAWVDAASQIIRIACATVVSNPALLEAGDVQIRIGTLVQVTYNLSLSDDPHWDEKTGATMTLAPAFVGETSNSPFFIPVARDLH